MIYTICCFFSPSSAAAALGLAGKMGAVNERLVLRPSNGVTEASDYLTHKHDWVQMEEEVTGPLRRAVFTPEGCAVTASEEDAKEL